MKLSSETLLLGKFRCERSQANPCSEKKSVWRKGDSLHTIGGNVNQHNRYGKLYRNSSKSEKKNYLTSQQSHFWVFIQKIYSWHAEGLSAFPCLLKYCSLFIVKLWNPPKCHSVDEWVKKMWWIHTQHTIQLFKNKEILSLKQHVWNWKAL